MSLTTTVSTKHVPRKSGGTGSLAGANPDRFAGVSWTTAFFMTLFHIGAVWALIDFTWSGVVVMLVTYYIALGWGIGMSYHRLLTHRAYKTPKFVEYFLTSCATTALEGGALFWVATHRRHHQHSDSDMDPHTPRHGGFWAHMGWIIFGEAQHNNVTMTSKYAPDLSRDGFHVWLSKYHWVPLTIQGLVLWALGGVKCVLGGVFLRVKRGLPATGVVNFAPPPWGHSPVPARGGHRPKRVGGGLTVGGGQAHKTHGPPPRAQPPVVAPAQPTQSAPPRVAAAAPVAPPPLPPPRPLLAGAGRRGGRRCPAGPAGGRFRAAFGDLVRDGPARRLSAGGRRCGPLGRRPVRRRLRRVRHDLAGHGRARHRRADQRAAEGLERVTVLRAGDARRPGPGADRVDPEQQLLL